MNILTQDKLINFSKQDFNMRAFKTENKSSSKLSKHLIIEHKITNSESNIKIIEICNEEKKASLFGKKYFIFPHNKKNDKLKSRKKTFECNELFQLVNLL